MCVLGGGDSHFMKLLHMQYELFVFNLLQGMTLYHINVDCTHVLSISTSMY